MLHTDTIDIIDAYRREYVGLRFPRTERYPDPVFRGSIVYYANREAAWAAMHDADRMLAAGVPMEDVSEAAALHTLLLGGAHR